MTHPILLLIPIAGLLGWYLGRSGQIKAGLKSSARLRHDYFVGLNYLINEQPDKAVDIFIKMLEVDTDTVETHLALGNLFRRRGEVDRAIRIHQNLIARPQLGKQERVHALAELGQDYMRAGVLDRAERLFLELVDMGEETIPSLRYLLNIYQQEKDWDQAIVIAQKLQAATHESMHMTIAHYHCELAERMFEQGNNEHAQRSLKKALAIDKNCARASLIHAKLEESAGRYKSAITHYKYAKQQDPDFLIETIRPLAYCYEKIDDEMQLVSYLQECLVDYPRISIILALGGHLQKTRGDRIAIDFLAEQIRQHPSLRGLRHLIDLYVANAEGQTRDRLMILRDLVAQLLEDRPVYRCSECGISGKTLYWHCPGCKNWSTTRPIHGLEGD